MIRGGGNEELDFEVICVWPIIIFFILKEYEENINKCI